ncbi:hypothetical protein EPI10_024249 [Gossypium australe]|uniref:Uncharacterized protein n=1 Tax=Gossypium australe TaxID=47621 RepID=A0A5B6VWF4_9ROSI|nr:hypothetical protein EPI10_024249 [Gossypium australe]
MGSPRKGDTQHTSSNVSAQNTSNLRIQASSQTCILDPIPTRQQSPICSNPFADQILLHR